MAYPFQDVATYKGNCSKLTDYILLTPSHFSSRENIKIDTITIHCTAGHFIYGSKDIAVFFYNTPNESSCNYAVGFNKFEDKADVALIVDEANRSWCSSNRANDKRAITIEVDSAQFDNAQDNYCFVYDAVIDKLIELLVDICTRYNIAPLKWEGNVELAGQVDKQNLTVHRWFDKDRTCPGGYLYSKHTYIANKVNEALFKNGVIKEMYTNTYSVQPDYIQKDTAKAQVSYKEGTVGKNYKDSPIIPSQSDSGIIPEYKYKNLTHRYFNLKKGVNHA